MVRGQWAPPPAEGKWQEAKGRRRLQTAIHPGVMPTPQRFSEGEGGREASRGNVRQERGGVRGEGSVDQAHGGSARRADMLLASGRETGAQ